ncbi:hypothetical protein HXX76_004552 [Chlamydomonas incerta]|nr:hypothetical protein HXX76_004552 [Chlamydomonas incerta]|eukprot:KAG2439189.1 hypothetical protein HXX76_004552 [Chlamydomonas incerta]
MRVFWEETRMGHQQFCEVSGAAICTKHSMWCQIHTFNQDSDVVGRDVKGGPMYRFNNSIDPQKWGELTVVNAAGARQAPPATLQVGNNTGNATALAAFNRTLNLMPGHIFHAVKW